MANPIIMPQIGQDITMGTIVEWNVREGDRVSKGDIIATVESEKAAFEVEATEDGTILKILYPAGEEAEVLKPIGYMGQPGEEVEGAAPAAPAPEKKETAPASQPAPAAPVVPAAPAAPVTPPDGKVKASPSARRMAREKGIDLAAVSGSGPDGRIIKKDVLAQAGTAPEAAPAAGPALVAPTPAVQPAMQEDQVVTFNRMRKTIADRLTASKQTIPHFYINVEVDMSACLAWRKAYNDKHQTRITVNDLLIQAVAVALRQYPHINSHVDADRMVIKKNVNIGVAVAIEDGLLVPVIPDADLKDLQELSTLSKENAAAAARGIIKSQAIGTFTISNLGMFKVSGFLPIINPPECAILGVGGIAKKVTARPNGDMGVRDIMVLTLACDHRATDGTYAAQFLNRVKENLEDGLIP